MNFFISLLFCCSLWQATIPYKASDEFTIELEYKFKQKPGNADTNTRIDVDQSGTSVVQKKIGSGSLPYLMVTFRILKLSDGEERLRIVNGNGTIVLSKKAETDVVYRVDLGYTDDIKDRVTPHEFNIYLLSAKKKELSLVKLFIMEDGVFLVNDEIRGRFW